MMSCSLGSSPFHGKHGHRGRRRGPLGLARVKSIPRDAWKRRDETWFTWCCSSQVHTTTSTDIKGGDVVHLVLLESSPFHWFVAHESLSPLLCLQVRVVVASLTWVRVSCRLCGSLDGWTYCQGTMLFFSRSPPPHLLLHTYPIA